MFAERSLYSAIEFARPDLTMTKEEAERGGASFVLVCTHYTEDADDARRQPGVQRGHRAECGR